MKTMKLRVDKWLGHGRAPIKKGRSGQKRAQKKKTQSFEDSIDRSRSRREMEPDKIEQVQTPRRNGLTGEDRTDK